MQDATKDIVDWINTHCVPDTDNQVQRDTPLLETSVLDSVQILDLVAFIESHFGISIDMEELVPQNFETVDQVAAMVARIGAA